MTLTAPSRLSATAEATEPAGREGSVSRLSAPPVRAEVAARLWHADLGVLSLPTLTIENVSPAEGSTLGVLDTVSFDVVGDEDLPIVVTVRFGSGSEVEEVVHDGSAFQGYFDNPRSSRAPITDGFRYTIYRAGGWPRPITFQAYAVAEG